MVVPAHVRTTWSGVFGSLLSPVERWAFSVNSAGAQLQPAADPVALAALVNAWQTGLAPALLPNVRLTQVKVANIATSTTAPGGGQTAQYSGVASIQAADVPGTSAGPYWPLQVSLAISTQGAVNSPSTRGRFFLPGPAMGTLGADGLMTADRAQYFADRAKAFLDLFQATGLGGAVIASSKGALVPIVAVRCGRAPDTIRSRRADLKEGYGASVTVLPNSG